MDCVVYISRHCGFTNNKHYFPYSYRESRNLVGWMIHIFFVVDYLFVLYYYYGEVLLISYYFTITTVKYYGKVSIISDCFTITTVKRTGGLCDVCFPSLRSLLIIITFLITTVNEEI